MCFPHIRFIRCPVYVHGRSDVAQIASLLQKFGSCKKSTTDWKIGHTLQSEDFDFPASPASRKSVERALQHPLNGAFGV
jgi:hypothetical protein